MDRGLESGMSVGHHILNARWPASFKGHAHDRQGLLDRLTKAVPHKIHTILTDNGIQFAKRDGTQTYWAIPFDRLCDTLGIYHRLTMINHPWANGQVERMKEVWRLFRGPLEATRVCLQR